MCERIAYAHGEDVMHKDIILDKVMLCSVEPPQAVVIDVGLVEIFSPNEASSFRSEIHVDFKSTMAPEVLMDKFSCKYDIWSFGCCLYGLCEKTNCFLKPNGTLEIFPYPYPFILPEDPPGLRNSCSCYRKELTSISAVVAQTVTIS